MMELTLYLCAYSQHLSSGIYCFMMIDYFVTVMTIKLFFYV